MRFNKVVLITIDTLRADHLSSYGYRRKTSPFIDSLADQGVLFENAFSASSHTGSAHASLFTSLYPYEHGVLANSDVLRDDAHSLATMFKESTYETAAFASVRFLEGLRSGFNHFDRASGKTGSYSDANETTETVLAWLRKERPAEKLFLWIHYWDPHAWGKRLSDYKPKVPAFWYEKMRLPSAKKEQEFLDYLRKEQNLSLDFFGGDLPRMMLGINTYDAEIAYLDSELKRVFDWFEEQGLNEDTLWVILADHGEGLGNHGYGGHSKYLYQEQLRVPLVFYSKRKLFSIGRRDPLVRLVDVLPTLADLSNLSYPSHPIQGVSLLPLLKGNKKDFSAPPYSYAQRRAKDSTPKRGERRAHWDDGEVFSLQTLRSKYIYRTKGDDEFFDLVQDPFETKNIISQPSVEKDELLKKLQELEPKVLSVKRSKRKKADRRILKELKALGYL